MLVLAAPNTSGLDLSAGRVTSFIGRDKSRNRIRSALLVAGLAGLGRSHPTPPIRSIAATASALGRQSSWTRMIDAAAAPRTGRNRACAHRHRLPDNQRWTRCPQCTCIMRSRRSSGPGRTSRREWSLPRPCHGRDARTTEALVDRFLDMMAAEAGASRHTLAAYRNDLERSAEAIRGSLAIALSRRFVAARSRMGRACAVDGRPALSGAASVLRLSRG